MAALTAISVPQRNGPIGIVSSVQNVSTAATGVIGDSYTVPAGKIAKLKYAGFQSEAGSAVILTLSVTRGATLFFMPFATRGAAITAADGSFFDMWFIAGDVIQWDVITAVAATFADALFSIEEYSL